MKFRSPNLTPIRVASTTGHVAIVGPEYRELPPELHSEAFAKGCICDQQVMGGADPTADPYDRSDKAMVTGGERALIRAALKSMLNDRIERPLVRMNDDDDADARFTPSGDPRTSYVSQLAGITVAKEDVLAVWKELRDEALSAQDMPVKTGPEKAREAQAKTAAKKGAAAQPSTSA